MIQFPPTLPLVTPFQAQLSADMLASRRFWALRWLGTRYLLHPENQIKRKAK